MAEKPSLRRIMEEMVEGHDALIVAYEAKSPRGLFRAAKKLNKLAAQIAFRFQSFDDEDLLTWNGLAERGDN